MPSQPIAAGGHRRRTPGRRQAVAKDLHTALDVRTRAAEAVDEATQDGKLLRGEVLARWQEFVGTGEIFRGLEERSAGSGTVSRAFSSRPAPVEKVTVALETGLEAVIVDEADAPPSKRSPPGGATPAGRAPRRGPGGERSTSSSHEGRGSGAGVAGRVELVRTEGQDKRITARFLSFGVNGLGVALMIVVFAHTAGLTGAEIGHSRRDRRVGPKVLEAIFGDQAVRGSPRSARRPAPTHVRVVGAESAGGSRDRVDKLGRSGRGQALRESLVWVGQARKQEANR